MALNGKLILNGADYAPLNIYGVGVFMAFSGNGAYRNRGGCGAVPGDGPLPPGRYWVVDRGAGGFFGQRKAELQDTWNKYVNGVAFGRSEWFALYREDSAIDDETWYEGVRRELFRLHPGTISEGCITIPHNSDYARIRQAFMNTSMVSVPSKPSLMARGLIEVVANGSNTCP
ncbi:hypothetical protein NG99_11320 [Erwinia typographi]|uniref:Tlde1 domain-containing protein n=1 Tax=Erwinia typographi TaxID=371042 RepID=A0A0A3Z474_9GAMM|nr:DUF2778 domain-containing protein [Erwinia typographi]KGT93897.1 hypothetical protein NG99_11320 [Erwinia typographi]